MVVLELRTARAYLNGDKETNILMKRPEFVGKLFDGAIHDPYLASNVACTLNRAILNLRKYYRDIGLYLPVRRKEKVHFVIISNSDILVASSDNEETDRGEDGFNSKLALEDLKTLVLDCIYYARWEFNLNEDNGEKEFSIHFNDS
ncbi:unnamed protein product [Hermetia illucens]|uniref:Uncharacterized protein n=1 Tax=Hermetia illucens TaxID=343691 RepID=A0A7R8UI33_HERIL|nr:unnamed protein product [Hermetia illucens]